MTPWDGVWLCVLMALVAMIVVSMCRVGRNRDE